MRTQYDSIVSARSLKNLITNSLCYNTLELEALEGGEVRLHGGEADVAGMQDIVSEVSHARADGVLLAHEEPADSEGGSLDDAGLVCIQLLCGGSTGQH